MVLITNTARFPVAWRAASGESGETRFAFTADEFVRAAEAEKESVLLVNCDTELAFRLGRRLRGRSGPMLVSVDLVLRRPGTLRGKLLLPWRRWALSRFNYHWHYFRDVRGLDSLFGIGSKSGFVPFKANLYDHIGTQPTPGEGEYALCFGRSLRDFDTFFSAMEGLPVRGAIAQPNLPAMAAHGSRFTRPLAELPANITVLPDDNSIEAQIRILAGAKIVVLPIVRQSVVASGISTCLNAMLMGRCVIATEGPGSSDIFDREMLTVPVEDPRALADMIHRAWEDDDLRRRTAEAGRTYAVSLGGEAELYQRIINAVAQWRREVSGKTADRK